MFMFACVILFAVAASLSSVYAEDCLTEYNVTQEEIKGFAAAGDLTKVDSCFWGCYFRKLGLLNEKSQIDLDNYLITVRKLMKKDDEFAVLEKLGKRCVSVKDKPVSDGEAGCEIGALLAICFYQSVEDLSKMGSEASR